MTNATKNVLVIQSSSRKSGSTTRLLTAELINALSDEKAEISIIERDLTDGMPFVDQSWIDANFTAAEDRTADQAASLSFSDTLVDELMMADVIIIAAPIYNFGVPAALKAWIDQIARARVTFKYTDAGPVGLLEDKHAIIISASGGTEIGADIDFATGYLRHLLGFIGIKDVSSVAADRMMVDAEAALTKARAGIQKISRQLAESQKNAA
ncbi:MAG: NAD(P)H-dependent oxidoreductase [Pseudomonadota bacterium]